jgi:hypothetical protein
MKQTVVLYKLVITNTENPLLDTKRQKAKPAGQKVKSMGTQNPER